jgi:hypothetical protein
MMFTLFLSTPLFLVTNVKKKKKKKILTENTAYGSIVMRGE